MASPTVPSTFPSPADADFDDDVTIIYQPDDVLRMWHHVSSSSRDRVLGSTLINYALSSGRIHLPSTEIRAHVPTLLGDPDLDPWEWTLAELNNEDNPTYILNAFHNPVSLTYQPTNLITLRRLLRPVATQYSVSTITVHLHTPQPSLLPASSPAPEAAANLLQHLRIINAGTVHGPVPGGAPLCTASETQLLGHRLFFEWPRTPVNGRSRDAFSPDHVADTLDTIDDLFIYLIAPGITLDSSFDLTRLIVHLEISVHLDQAYHRLAGARP
ncbi:hypothetical protein CF326_g9642 [Tilletia indica]|nr:hypothetical protein CF326_g9642 [Tilletia indica]